MDLVVVVLISTVGVLSAIILAAFSMFFVAAFLGEPLSNSHDDFEETDALIQSERKLNK
jgi:hypothetical protein